MTGVQNVGVLVGAALVLMVLLAVGAAGQSSRLTARAWNIKQLELENELDITLGKSRSGEKEPKVLGEYPESAFLDGKTESGISMSGGGTRAYLTSLGYLRGLLDLGLLNKARYLSTVSGGSWANAAYSYFQRSKVGISEEDFLGEIVEPELLTMDKLKDLDMRSGRASPVKQDFLATILKKLVIDGMDPKDIYQSTVAEIFLEPAGLGVDDQVIWSPEVLKSTIKSNPGLSKEKFVFRCEGEHVCENKPFAILNAAVLGPKLASPFDIYNNNYIPIEFSSLYVGSPQHHIIRYPSHDTPGAIVNMTVGGFVETYAFGGLVRTTGNQSDNRVFPRPFFGLGPNSFTAVLQNVPMPIAQFTLANATAASSFAPGSILSGSPLLKALDNALGLVAEYWSPVTRRPLEPVFSMPVFLADGASVENNGFLALLRRKMKEIVVFIHSPSPLQPRSVYNPFKRAPRITDIDPAFSCFFGIDHEIPNVAENLSHNQVFPRYQFPSVVDKMQKAQAAGTGIVVRQELRTIENSFWGIAANQRVTVTWVYLGRCREWEKALPAEVRRQVVPRRHAENPAAIPKHGHFANFPHIPTSQLHYSAQQANLMANLAGWVIRRNADTFRKAFASGNEVQEVLLDQLSTLN